MKRWLLATVSSLALTGVASAADLPARMPLKAAPPATVPSWAGPYVGISSGAVWHRLNTSTDAEITSGYFDSERTAATGALFGGQVGYNWQAHNIVYGLEADLNWVGAHGSETKIPYFLPISYETKLTWLATVRARAGMAFGRTLLYGTGGLAVGGVDNSWIFIGCPCSLVENREARVGWTAGGGIEHFIAANLTAKAEVLYVDLGRGNATDIFGDYISRFKNTAIVGRLGVNLKW